MASWTWAAASARGTSHELNGEGRQDAYRVLSAFAGFLIAVACDGAGSACRGRLGAVIATRILSARASDWVSRHRALPSPGALDLWVAEVRLIILVHADRLGCPAGDFAATLALAISDGTSTITAHVGDGAIVGRYTASGEIVPLSWPKSGEYASTTFFITDEILQLRVGVATDLPIDRLAAMTDGLSGSRSTSSSKRLTRPSSMACSPLSPAAWRLAATLSSAVSWERSWHRTR